MLFRIVYLVCFLILVQTYAQVCPSGLITEKFLIILMRIIGTVNCLEPIGCVDVSIWKVNCSTSNKYVPDPRCVSDLVYGKSIFH